MHSLMKLNLLRILRRHARWQCNLNYSSTANQNAPETASSDLETVFEFPAIKYLSLLNRLKIYQLLGTSIAIPSCGILELLNTVPSGACLSASYIGLTGAVALTLGTLPFRNTIGYLYISKDNEKVKISSMDFWGRRKDVTIAADDWIPLLDMSPKITDPFYLSPKLTNGSEFKLFVKFGNVINAKKVGEVLE